MAEESPQHRALFFSLAKPLVAWGLGASGSEQLLGHPHPRAASLQQGSSLPGTHSAPFQAALELISWEGKKELQPNLISVCGFVLGLCQRGLQVPAGGSHGGGTSLPLQTLSTLVWLS